MARVPVDDLVALVKGSPKYYREWSGEAAADIALQVRFAVGRYPVQRTQTLACSDGRTLVLDFDAQDGVLGIEIH